MREPASAGLGAADRSGWGPGAAAAAVLAAGIAVIAAAWGFELIGGYEPCALCLEQRWAYYLGVPMAALAALGARLDCPRCAAVSLAGAAVVFAYGAGLGAYHAGVEWHLWQGPAACAATGSAIPTDVSDLMASLQHGKVPSCTEAAWRLFGISLAGYNALISAALCLVAGLGAWAGLSRATATPRHRSAPRSTPSRD